MPAFKESKQTLKSVLKIMTGKEFSYLKNQLAEVLISEICPIGNKIEDLMNNQSHLEAILKKGKERAEIKSEETLKNIREIVGLI